MFETMLTVVGNVISEPVLREVPGGHRVTSFRLLSTARRFDKTASEWVDGDRVFATVNCWKRLAEGVCATIRKGDPVVVTGRLRTREYEVGDQRRTTTEIEANALGLDLARAVAVAPRDTLGPAGMGVEAAECPQRAAPPGG